MSMVINGTSGITFPDGSLQGIGVGRRNLIINGAMQVAQRGTSAITANDGTYGLDRFVAIATANGKFTMQQNSGSVTPPTGFTNYLGCVSTAATSVGAGDFYQVRQKVEGFNSSVLGWGTSGALSASLSFWVRSSLTGTFGGSITNSAGDRTYSFGYTISSADTWEYKTVSIDPTTTGTWLTGSSNGLQLGFSLGSGATYQGTDGAWSDTFEASVSSAVDVVATNGATWYITGVQLEVGSVATPFEHRSYGEELALCQRYFEKSYAIATAPGSNAVPGFVDHTSSSTGTSNVMFPLKFAVAKRAAPTVTGYKTDGTSGQWDYNRSGASGSATFTYDQFSEFGGRIYIGSVGASWATAEIQGHWVASSEL